MNATPAGWKDPPAGTVHVFGVVRIDLFQVPAGDSPPPEQWDSIVSGTGAFWDLADARHEAGRLNALNGPKGSRYVAVTLRSPPPAPPEKR